MNPRLRTIIADAKASNMPADNIKRAIRRGTGEEPGVSYEEAQYEAYGPGGAAVIIDVLTDNKNRTVGELRHMLDQARRQPRRDQRRRLDVHQDAATSSSQKTKADEETLMAAVLDAGGDDLRDDDDNWEVLSSPEAFQHGARGGEEARASSRDAAEVSMLPQNYLKLEGKPAQQMVKLMEALDDHDDVRHVWSNFDIEEKEIEASLA